MNTSRLFNRSYRYTDSIVDWLLEVTTYKRRTNATKTNASAAYVRFAFGRARQRLKPNKPTPHPPQPTPPLQRRDGQPNLHINIRTLLDGMCLAMDVSHVRQGTIIVFVVPCYH
jgi:hypothetical protein